MRLMTDARWHVRFNVVAMVIWAALLVPSVMIWRDSVFYVVLMSWYAIMVGHLAAFMAARAEQNAAEAP